ncbi:MAG: NAD-dependent epimerase/dehydratase family protein [Tenacibaculum sp.]
MILITGATGFLGSHLLYHLVLYNDSVLAIYRTKEKIKATKRVFGYYSNQSVELMKKINWIRADITEIPSLEKVFSYPITQVYHCAALVSFYLKDYKKMRKTNIEGTANLLNFCIDKRIDNFCFVSSISTLGTSDSKYITEEHEWYDSDKNHCYAITKQGAEMEVWRASQEGLNTIIVNPGVILGSGFWNEGSGRLFTKIYRGFKFYTEGVTGFIGVKDVVKAMTALVEAGTKNQRYVLVSENKSFKEVFLLIAEGFKKKAPSFKIGKASSELIWRVDNLLNKITGKSPWVSKQALRLSQQKHFYSSKKIQSEINFKFSSITQVIAEICSNFLSDLRNKTQ